MTPTDWAAIFVAISTPLGLLIGVLKWHIGRMDIKAAKEIDRQDDLREELRTDMQRRIDELLKTVNMQRALINGYMRHVKALEKMMIKAGPEPPEIDLDELMRELP